jgi:hypothetical protein
LCGLGSQNDRLLVFRRPRRTLVSTGARRLHRLHIRSTAAERQMLARLAAFGKAVRAEHANGSRDVWIALALLHKRAHSSAHALRLSVMRRLDRLAGVTSHAAQLLLPLDETGETNDDEPPEWPAALGLANPGDERRLLKSIVEAASLAEAAESKTRAICRLLRRVRERVIVFTEYRDTLSWLARQLSEPCLMLHGGLSRSERRVVLDSFLEGTTRVLLATDAAAEGLNLHQVCRVVVNLELPWNPMRLEQRIGRVDRIGQRRTVHAFHLVGADTREMQLLDDLRARIAHAQADIGAPNPLGDALDSEPQATIRSDAVDVAPEMRRLALARVLLSDALMSDDGNDTRPLIATARNRKTRARLAGRTLSLWECVLSDGREQAFASLALGAWTSANPSGPDQQAWCGDAVSAASRAWESAANASALAFAAVGRRRAAAIASAIENERLSLHQPGLFDRRADFAHAALHAAQVDALASQAERQDVFRQCANVAVSPPRLRLVLVP